MLSSSEVEAVLRLPRAEKEKLLLPLEARARARAAKAEEARRAGFAASFAQVRERCQTLAGFVREAWPVLEPSAPYIHGWHIDAVCAHLEAVTAGRITRLLINIPPGMMKSLLVSVLWPAWEWGPCGLASMRYLTTSYSEDYAKRDARRMRDLVESEWYQALWGDAVRLTRSGEKSFSNTAQGWREAKPFASLTGGRGDRVIVDDPHSTEKAESPADRETTTRIFRESLPTRVNDAQKSAIVIIMQRLHEEDVSGQAIALKLGYDHLMLPMEFEPDRRCRTSIGFTDPRTYEGELLFPERFPRSTVDRDKIPLGGHAVAGQFQQRPAPREGGMFKRSWFEIVDAIPATANRKARAWDLGATESGGDYTVGLKASRAPEGVFYIEDVKREQFGPAGVERLIVTTASQDGTACTIRLPQDPGAAGKAYAATLITKLAGYPVKAVAPTGDKATRATPAAAQAEAGNIKLLRGPWNEAFLDEVCAFPSAAHDDQVDALADAINHLALGHAPGGTVKVKFG
jgi:predicted phage terminase large subunit-like protein